jgi:nucleoside-diphosphate-sugar epimerase
MGKVLITGISGAIGHNFLHYALDNNIEPENLICTSHNNWLMTAEEDRKFSKVTFHPCNLEDRSSVIKIFEKHDIDKIVHLAAVASPRSDDIARFHNLNIKATHYLLEHCKKPTDFVFASSILVYGDNNIGGFVESDALKPDTVYGVTKVAAENLITLYYKKGKVRPRILRFCGNVGLYSTHGKIHEALSGQKEMTLYGESPGNYIPLCHVEDTCRAILSALDSNRPEVLCNISPSDYISLEDCLKLVNPNIKITWVKDGRPPSCLNIHNERANYTLNWRPQYSSKDALLRAIKEVRSNGVH